jgi:hypothetical protein
MYIHDSQETTCKIKNNDDVLLLVNCELINTVFDFYIRTTFPIYRRLYRRQVTSTNTKATRLARIESKAPQPHKLFRTISNNQL